LLLGNNAGLRQSGTMSDESALIETTTDGPRTKRWVLESSSCRELAAHRIARLGLDEALPPYRRVRLQPQGSFLMACVSGSGRVLLDGRLQKVGPGTVCMAPPRVLNAFHAESKEPWTFAWLRYDEPSYVAPLVGASSPLVVNGGAVELARAIEGLRAEWEGVRDPKLLHHWVELVQGMARRHAQPFHMHERLWKLWDIVSDDLAQVWTLDSLAKSFHASVEHLRRICHRELGRSPMQHLTYMRIQSAKHLLETTTDKLEVIAGRVGYGNAFVFSRAFKRWVGCAPAEYRGRK
jgi:AraC-like DNA-binding protein